MKNIIITDFTKKIIIHDVTEYPKAIYEIGGECDVTIIIPITQSVDASLHVILTKSQSAVRVIGLAHLQGNQKVIVHTDQKHVAPGAMSNLIVKAVVADNSQFFYDGYIQVEKNAQKTDAYQRNENLLLSSEARAESKPGLEILANDVRCTHGATISMISKEQEWYLKSRGINQQKAQSMIVNGFLLSAIMSLDENTQQIIKKELHIV